MKQNPTETNVPRGCWFVLDSGLFGLSLGERVVLFYPDGRLHPRGSTNLTPAERCATVIVDSEPVSADVGRLVKLLASKLPTTRVEPLEPPAVVAPRTLASAFGDLGLDAPA